MLASFLGDRVWKPVPLIRCWAEMETRGWGPSVGYFAHCPQGHPSLPSSNSFCSSSMHDGQRVTRLPWEPEPHGHQECDELFGPWQGREIKRIHVEGGWLPAKILCKGSIWLLGDWLPGSYCALNPSMKIWSFVRSQGWAARGWHLSCRGGHTSSCFRHWNRFLCGDLQILQHEIWLFCSYCPCSLPPVIPSSCVPFSHLTLFPLFFPLLFFPLTFLSLCLCNLGCYYNYSQYQGFLVTFWYPPCIIQFISIIVKPYHGDLGILTPLLEKMDSEWGQVKCLRLHIP